jgi:hypothetical protein
MAARSSGLSARISTRDPSRSNSIAEYLAASGIGRHLAPIGGPSDPDANAPGACHAALQASAFPRGQI